MEESWDSHASLIYSKAPCPLFFPLSVVLGVNPGRHCVLASVLSLRDILNPLPPFFPFSDSLSPEFVAQVGLELVILQTQPGICGCYFTWIHVLSDTL